MSKYIAEGKKMKRDALMPYYEDEGYHFSMSYLAGFFDGEGCIYINKFQDKRKHCRTKYQFALAVSVSNVDPRPLRLFRENFGGYIRKKPQKNHPKWRIAWEWKASSNAAEVFLQHALPYFINKKEEAELALEYKKDFVNHSGRRRTNEENEKRDNYYKKMRLLKRREWLVNNEQTICLGISA